MVEHSMWKARATKALRGTRGKDYPLLPRGSTYRLDWRQHASPAVRPEKGLRAGADSPGVHDYLHPVATSFAGLALHQRLVLDRDDQSDTIVALARALCDAQGANGTWEYPVSVPYYGRGPGWVSGMAQGLAMSFLLRAGSCARDQKVREQFVDAMERAHDALLRPLDGGGCSDWDSAGRPFFEECPATPLPFILNGAVFAVVGLHEYESVRGGGHARPAAERLSELLPRWDLGYWSSYDATRRTPSSPDYHRLHVSQLQLLADLFPDLAFDTYASAFSSYSAMRSSRIRAFTTLVVTRSMDTLAARSTHGK